MKVSEVVEAPALSLRTRKAWDSVSKVGVQLKEVPGMFKCICAMSRGVIGMGHVMRRYGATPPDHSTVTGTHCETFVGVCMVRFCACVWAKPAKMTRIEKVIGGNDARTVAPVRLNAHMLIMQLSGYAGMGPTVSTEKQTYALELTAVLTSVTRATTLGTPL